MGALIRPTKRALGGRLGMSVWWMPSRPGHQTIERWLFEFRAASGKSFSLRYALGMSRVAVPRRQRGGGCPRIARCGRGVREKQEARNAEDDREDRVDEVDAGTHGRRRRGSGRCATMSTMVVGRDLDAAIPKPMRMMPCWWCDSPFLPTESLLFLARRINRVERFRPSKERIIILEYDGNHPSPSR